MCLQYQRSTLAASAFPHRLAQATLPHHHNVGVHVDPPGHHAQLALVDLLVPKFGLSQGLRLDLLLLRLARLQHQVELGSGHRRCSSDQDGLSEPAWAGRAGSVLLLCGGRSVSPVASSSASDRAPGVCWPSLRMLLSDDSMS